MYFFCKEDVLKDIENSKLKGHFDKIRKIYSKMPVTKCDECGNCCYDSPTCYYVEFLFVYDQFNMFEKEQKIEILKNAIRHEIYGLSIENKPCVFLNAEKRCIVHERAPFSCKLWGLQNINEYEKNISGDNERNKACQDYFAKRGIHISNEFIDSRKLNYCNKVKIVKDPYRISSNDHNQFVKDLANLAIKYQNKNVQEWSVVSYLVYTYIGSKIGEDRINIIKDYQDGNLNAIEDYINQFDFEKLIE